MWLRCVMLVMAVLFSAPPLLAQEPPKESRETLNIDRLPIDLERLGRQLRQSAVREESEGLTVRYTVDVYGQAPKIDLFSGDDYWATGPAPYGAPTHAEMLYQMTPEEFRAPAADLNSLFRWVMERVGRK